MTDFEKVRTLLEELGLKPRVIGGQCYPHRDLYVEAHGHLEVWFTFDDEGRFQRIEIRD